MKYKTHKIETSYHILRDANCTFLHPEAVQFVCDYYLRTIVACTWCGYEVFGMIILCDLKVAM